MSLNGERRLRRRLGLKPSKITLFSEVTHHLNNPLSHIQGEVLAIRNTNRSITDTILDLLPDNTDEATASLREHFEKLFKDVERSQTAVDSAQRRATDAIELLRRVSGVDGIPMDATSMGEVMEVLRERGDVNLSAMDWTRFKDHNDHLVIGHRLVYGYLMRQVLHHIHKFSIAERPVPETPKPVAEIQVEGDDKAFLRLNLPLSNDLDMDTEIAFRGFGTRGLPRSGYARRRLFLRRVLVSDCTSLGALPGGAGMRFGWLIVMVVWSSIGCVEQSTRLEQPRLKDGVVDVSDWDFEKDGPIELKGDWLFSWGGFTAPGHWSELAEKLPDTAPVPAGWGALKESHGIQRRGHATYALKIIGLKRADLRVEFAGLTRSVKTSIVDGVVVDEARLGRIGDSRATEIPVAWVDPQVRVSLRENSSQPVSSVSILVHLANYHHPRGGISSAPVLIVSNETVMKAQTNRFFSHLLLGFLLIAGLYHLVLFLLRRDDQAALYFWSILSRSGFEGRLNGGWAVTWVDRNCGRT